MGDDLACKRHRNLADPLLQDARSNVRARVSFSGILSQEPDWRQCPDARPRYVSPW